jgi:hypothetical protein
MIFAGYKAEELKNKGRCGRVAAGHEEAPGK